MKRKWRISSWVEERREVGIGRLLSPCACIACVAHFKCVTSNSNLYFSCRRHSSMSAKYNNSKFERIAWNSVSHRKCSPSTFSVFLIRDDVENVFIDGAHMKFEFGQYVWCTTIHPLQVSTKHVECNLFSITYYLRWENVSGAASIRWKWSRSHIESIGDTTVNIAHTG